MSAALVALLLALGAQDPFQASLEATGRGDYRAALRLAGAETVPPAESARARLWAYFHAGLLERALAEAERGLVAAPDDPWLRARAVELAVAMHHPVAAARHLAAWELVQPTPADPASVELRQAARALAASEERRRDALARARAIAAAVLAGGAVAVALLGRSRP